MPLDRRRLLDGLGTVTRTSSWTLALLALVGCATVMSGPPPVPAGDSRPHEGFAAGGGLARAPSAGGADFWGFGVWESYSPMAGGQFWLSRPVTDRGQLWLRCEMGLRFPAGAETDFGPPALGMGYRHVHSLNGPWEVGGHLELGLLWVEVGGSLLLETGAHSYAYITPSVRPLRHRHCCAPADEAPLIAATQLHVPVGFLTAVRGSDRASIGLQGQFILGREYQPKLAEYRLEPGFTAELVMRHARK